MSAPPKGVVRLATIGDLDALLPLVRAYHEFEHIRMDGPTRRKAVCELLENQAYGCVLLACIDGRPVGYLALCFGYSIEFAGRDAFVDEFFLEEAARGRGIGRELLRSAAEHAQREGIGALHLEVAKDNRRARAFYESEHFALRDGFRLMSRYLKPHR